MRRRGSSPYDTTYGDGDEIDDATLAEIRADIALALETGDVVVVDNFLTGHGRISWDPSVTAQRRMLLQQDSSIGIFVRNFKTTMVQTCDTDFYITLLLEACHNFAQTSHRILHRIS